MVSFAALLAYIPSDRRDAMAKGLELPHRTSGAALCADLSGFTSLTEAMARYFGPRRGAEELAVYLNRFYDALIAPIGACGGSVVAFSGDAITCWFDADDGERAITAALAMQNAMQPFLSLQLGNGERMSLGVKIAIVTGAVRRFRVGDPAIQFLDTLAGASMDRLAVLGRLAHTGEILLDEVTASPRKIAEWRSDPLMGLRAAVLDASSAQPQFQPLQFSEKVPVLTEEQIRPWLLPAVFARLQSGQGEFLTELRPAVALFLRFDGLDYDDERVGVKLDAVIREVQRILAEYKGTLLQLTIGDKGSYLYAAFGAPVAHEDDVTRAVAAALVLRLLPVSLTDIHSVSIGLSRGLMCTGAYGSSLCRTYGALGDAVNLAARLMERAAPEQILASESIWQHSIDFDWQVLPALEVKGRRTAVTPAALLGRLEPDAFAARATLSASPMIGRQDELLRVEEKLTLARSGRGQIVSIVADAGMGKSRLLAEVLRRVDAAGLVCYSNECQSYGTQSAYLVWHAIWRALFGIADVAPAQQIETLEKSLLRANPDFVLRMPLLAPILNLPIPDNGLTNGMDARLRKTLREALLVDFLRHQTTNRPLIVIIEDTHWIDPVSADLLEGIGRAIEALPVLILLTHRPVAAASGDFLPWLTGLAYATRIPLNELTVTEVGQLLAARLAHFGMDGEISPALVERIATRTQGNPFYAEELFNYLHDRAFDPRLDSAWDQADLPESLHSLILSRIDQLSERQQVTIKAASIIGRLFRVTWLYEYYSSLGAIQVADDLEKLDQLDLVVQDVPEPHLAYIFKHVITQEVAYESLTYAVRANLHEQFARYLEQIAGDGAASFLDLLAYHYSRSDRKDRALHYLILAGQKAMRNYNLSEAQKYFEDALSLLPDVQHSNQQALEIHVGLGDVLALVGDYPNTRAAFEHAVQILTLDENINYETICSLQRKIGMTHECQGDYDQALVCLDVARQTLEEGGIDSPAELAQVLSDAGWVHFNRGEVDHAEKYLTQAQQLAERTVRLDIISSIYNRLGGVHYYQDQLQQARDFVMKSLTIREEIGDMLGAARSYSNLGNLCWKLGVWDEALDHFKHSAELQTKLGDEDGIIKLKNNLGLLQIDRGYIDEAREYLEDALHRAENIGHKFNIAVASYHISLTFSVVGEWKTALDYSLRSEVVFKNIGQKVKLADVYVNMGVIYLGMLDLPMAEQYGEQTLALLNEFAANADSEVKGFAVRLLGDVALASHDVDKASERYHEAERIFGLADNPLERGRLLVSLARLSAAQSDKALAASRMALAQKLFEQLGARLDLFKLETLKKELAL